MPDPLHPAPLHPDGLMLFDGVCHLCSTSVRIADHLDRAKTLRFTPIQSPYGAALARAHGIDPDTPSTFAFFDKGQARLRSDGALALLARTPWRWLVFLRLIPGRSATPSMAGSRRTATGCSAARRSA